MTRFITYCDPELAALEAERQDMLRQLSATDALLEDYEGDGVTAETLKAQAYYIERRLDHIAARILAREAALDGAAD